ncbi:DUF3231 family protein [Lentibacillus amyloliquefaciens]|uniref:DUF3231 domain-containing protein n=1 Tax=Lentibacillus amyloliquefaciens TaxID=1472767 RepID=A0A0U4EBW3_9BACI|nr:DUF3231 family protein [Lentibacillus amyloliquefaciens]ALX50513.1 hypothetical protein AOX59_02180 [Lentibacillus amyloliquefaciens]
MDQTQHNPRLNSSELSQLWTSYMQDSMTICTTKHFMQIVEDADIRPVIQQTLTLVEARIPKLTALFQADNRPVPFGFSDQDVDLQAPRLFSDEFMLNNIKQTAQMAMQMNAQAIALCARQDVRDYFSESLQEATQLHDEAMNVLLSKGIYVRAPFMDTPDQVDFVTKQSFLAGWFGEQRPLLSLEIANLYANTQRNALGSHLLTGYSQVAKSNKVQKYFKRGKEISSKHVQTFTTKLQKEGLPASMLPDEPVTNSTVSPFSDKLMLFQSLGLNQIGIAYYGTSVSTALRHDLAALYPRLMAEIAKYAEDGANLMIENGWLEEPPRMIDHDQIAKKS